MEPGRGLGQFHRRHLLLIELRRQPGVNITDFRLLRGVDERDLLLEVVDRLAKRSARGAFRLQRATRTLHVQALCGGGRPLDLQRRVCLVQPGAASLPFRSQRGLRMFDGATKRDAGLALSGQGRPRGVDVETLCGGGGALRFQECP